MAKAKNYARELRYTDLPEMLADVEHMLASGYEKHGNWTLGQAAGHVADWARFPMDGFPTPPAPLRLIFWGMRKTGFAAKIANKIIAEGFKPGMATAPATVPSADSADEEGVQKLRDVVAQLQRHSGELHESPLFGKMDHETHVSVTLLHAAHHFAFLAPASSQAVQ